MTITVVGKDYNMSVLYNSDRLKSRLEAAGFVVENDRGWMRICPLIIGDEYPMTSENEPLPVAAIYPSKPGKITLLNMDKKHMEPYHDTLRETLGLEE